MAVSSFDTLAAAAELRDAGFDEKQTRAIIDIQRNAREELATKADIETLETGLEHLASATKADLTALRAELRADLYRALWIQGVGIIAILTALRFLPFG